MERKVIILHPQKLMRDMFKTILNVYCEVETLDSDQDKYDIIDYVKQTDAEVIIIHSQLLERYGGEFSERIRQVNRSIKIVGIGAYLDQEPTFIKSENSNIYSLDKEKSCEELLKYLRMNIGKHRSSALTEREKQVLLLVTEGFSTKKIASKLFVSVKTINSHRESICKKLKTSNLAKQTKYAILEGLTSLT